MANPKQQLRNRGPLGLYTSVGRVADSRVSSPMIEDAAEAEVEKIMRVQIPSMTNARLIKEAKHKSNQILRGHTTGPRHHNAIVETLFEMLHTMEDRIQRAPRDKVTFLPNLAGVKWDTNDPLAGIVEAIEPFGMSNFWTLRIVQAIPITQHPRRKLRKPKPPPKPTPPPKKPTPSKPKQVTVKEAIKRARDALGNPRAKRPGNFMGELWYYCVLMKMEDPSADMWYMDSNDMFAVVSKEQSLRSPKDGIPKRIKNDASVVVTGSGTYLLTTSQRATLDRLHSGWPKKVLYGPTAHKRDLYVLELTSTLVDPTIRKFYVSKHRDARKKVTNLVRDSGNDHTLILQRLTNLRADINGARNWWYKNIASKYGSDPGLGGKLIKDRWDKAWASSKSFLGCTRKWGKR